jgi:hypothetical protein
VEGAAFFLTSPALPRTVRDMTMKTIDRRAGRRVRSWQSRRRYGRVHMDVDWMLEGEAGETWGRGLDLSLRSACLPLTRAVGKDVCLQISLPGRARLLRARGHVAQVRAGVVVRFHDVSSEDLKLLGDCLIATGGLKAIPQLAQKFQRFTELHRRFLGTST